MLTLCGIKVHLNVLVNMTSLKKGPGKQEVCRGPPMVSDNSINQ